MDTYISIVISLALFAIGIIGMLAMRNALIFFLSIELILNATNILFVTFALHWANEIGLLWIFFIFVIAAAEAAVGLAIIINVFRTRQLVDIDQYNLLKE